MIEETTSEFDLVVLGSGSAAFAAGIRAKELGASVALCESNVIGGTCVNVGCVPSKAMLSAADLYHRAGHNPYSGVSTTSGKVDLAALVQSKNELVDEMRASKYENLVDEYGFELFSGHGSFTGPDTFSCDGREIRADRYLIATGASPFVPPIPGLEEAGYLTSTTALELNEVPESIVVIGANAIGLEMGQLFSRLGSKVTFLEALDRIVPFEEPEISGELKKVLADEGMETFTGIKVTGVEKDGERQIVNFEKDSVQTQVESETILVATGRRPNSEGIGLDLAGIELADRGAIRIDDTMRTTNPRVFAAGDVTTSPQFVYVAASQGSIAAENAITGSERTIDWSGMPRVTFTSPQIASVGLTAKAAFEEGHAVESRVLKLDSVPRAIVNRDTRGAIKIVADAGTGQVLGVHILADGAGDVALAGIYAIRGEMTVTEVAEAWGPYLTMGEGLKLAAQSFTKDVSSLSCCAA